MVVVSCPDRSDLLTHEDMLRSALSRQLDADKIGGLRSNSEAMKRPAASVSAIPESVASAEAAAVSARSDALAALPVTSLRPKRIRKRRQNILRPGDIGTGHQCLQYT